MVAERSAHFEPLTPTAYLDRSAEVFADRIAVVDGEVSYTHRELRVRCTQQAGMLVALGVLPADRVAVRAPNTHVLLETDYGVPYTARSWSRSTCRPSASCVRTT